jgi:hypothetical protein
MWDAAKFGFAVFVYEQFKAWRTRREIEMPEYARREPMLDAPGPGNRPVFDPTDGRELQRHRLHDRITHAMHQITVPLARHATTAELIFDGRPLGTFTRRTPRWTKEEINTAPTVYFQGLRAGAPQTGA